MSDTNMHLTSYSLMIMTHEEKLTLSLKCYQNVIEKTKIIFVFWNEVVQIVKLCSPRYKSEVIWN